MTQPPGQQPPQGGFGAPYDPAPGQAQPPPPPPPGPGPGYGSARPGPYNAPGRPGPYNPPAQPGPYNPPAQPGPYDVPAQPGASGQPAQPGPYGAPAQPGPYNAPAQPGPYGIPQPGPYGAPAPPAHGYPQQPRTPGPSGPSRGPFRGRPAVIIGAALAALLVVGGGVYLGTGGGGNDKPLAEASAESTDGGQPSTPPPAKAPSGADRIKERAAADARETKNFNAGRKPGEARVDWLQTNTVDLPRLGADAYGPWVFGDTVVRGMYRTLSGYSVADGEQRWSLKFGANICAVPNEASTDGKLVIGLMNGTSDNADCAELQMVDLRTGKAGWKKSVDRKGVQDLLSDLAMGISGGVVTFGRTSVSNAYRVADGTELNIEQPGNCRPFAFASGPRMIAATSCLTDDADVHNDQVQEFDPATGKPKWTYKVKTGWQVDHFYSVSPLVVSLKKRGQWGIVALNENGTYRSQMTGKGDYAVRCADEYAATVRNIDGCIGAAADANTFYLATKQVTSDTAPNNAVVAFDLDTGKQKWRVESPAGQTVQPLRMAGSDLLVQIEATYRKSGGLATVAPSGGALRTVLRYPASTSRVESSLFLPRVVYTGGRSFLMSAAVREQGDKEELKAKTMIVFSG
ncbi:PQQ-binding-like beta-propeller repeat protein [Streptomyces sp. NPDC088251]|uniref:outer membrane protein assembly factor BamB family protein n=1 Tax=Streptomyces sp. NPDC088251 TaxID=3365844 RepID=UPI0037F82E69